MENLYTSMRISASGLKAERMRMDTIASNIANATTTRTEEGGPYKRKVTVFEENLKIAMNKNTNKMEKASEGVKVAGVIEDDSPLQRVYNPSHPDADEEGYVMMPNVNILNEMVDLITATRSYEANVTVMNATKGMMLKTLELGRG